MADRSRPLATDPPDKLDAYSAAIKRGNLREEYYAARIRLSLAGRMVRQLLRIAPRPIRQERA